jgi:hypothetical protein
MGKPYARFDEGALGYPLSAVVLSRRGRRNVREQLQGNTSALLYPAALNSPGRKTGATGSGVSWFGKVDITRSVEAHSLVGNERLMPGGMQSAILI